MSAVKECARRAAEAGAVIAVQNHHDIAGHSETFLQFLRAVDEPACRAAFWMPSPGPCKVTTASPPPGNWLL